MITRIEATLTSDSKIDLKYTRLLKSTNKNFMYETEKTYRGTLEDKPTQINKKSLDTIVSEGTLEDLVSLNGNFKLVSICLTSNKYNSSIKIEEALKSVIKTHIKRFNHLIKVYEQASSE